MHCVELQHNSPESMNETKSPRPHKILFVMNHLICGGTSTVLIEYLNYLAAHTDGQITLAIMLPMGKREAYHERISPKVRVIYILPDNLLARRAQDPDKQIYSKGFRLFDEIFIAYWRRRRLRLRLRRLAMEHDVVIDFVGAGVRYLEGLPVRRIVWWHGCISWIANRYPKSLERRRLFWRNADHLVCVAKEMANEAEHYFPYLQGKTSTIYNAIDPVKLREMAQQPTTLPLPEEEYVVAVSRLEPVCKDFATLLKAFALLHERLPQMQLCIVGTGESEHDLRDLAQSLGIASVVHFMGFQSNPFPYVAQSRLLVHSSRSEGLPTVLIEAMMLDVPCVCTDCPTGPKEILDSGQAGLLTPVGDAPAMAEAMHKLLTDETLRSTILQHAAEHRKKFLFENTAPELLRVLELH